MTRWFVFQSLGPHHCDPYVSIEETWAAHKVNSKSGIFQPLFRCSSFPSFLAEAKQTFINFPSRPTKNLGALRQILAVYEASTPVVTNVLWVAWCSPKCSRLSIISLVLTLLKYLNPTQKSCTNHSSLTKEARESSIGHWNVSKSGRNQLQPKEGVDLYINMFHKTSRWVYQTIEVVLRHFHWHRY
jgi:hypothetical protein